MKALKFTWKIVLNLLIVPFSLSIVVALIVGYITQSGNQDLENYAVKQENVTRLKADKIVAVPIADPSFDAVSIAFLLTFALVFVFMIIYMIPGKKKDPAAV
ncbi:MAG: hypothetical protein K0S33_3764 [Bacteroidetes bacterium]|jgi:hypothetical protein|nr:hypothetical protein [Bacteroidota bacterium]